MTFLKQRAKSLAGAGVTFAAFTLFGWRIPRIILPDASTPRTILTTILILLAGGAAAIVFLLIRGREKQKAARQSPDHDIDDAFHTAQKALATAQLEGVKKPDLRTMPLILVAGPGGSAKTSVVLQSGLDPELLAGEVRRGTAVVSTTSPALWYAHGTIVVEAGGKIVGDEKRWARLTKQLLPGRLAASFTGRSPAPRRVLLCFGCDELLKPGASESVPAAAQKLRTRLMDLARQLGVELPVYVVFTKADRLPYFTDYVRSFTRDEAQEVLGATLPFDLVEDSAWASRQDQRIGTAFEEIFRSLAARRLHVLSRETEFEFRSAAYEFPREFRKVAELATRFLIELSRPSPLHVEPVLRGFYFTGVRPVVVSDPGAAAAPAAPSVPAPDATMVLSAREVAAAARSAGAAGARKVPEWMFLRRLFRDVILTDGTAKSLTGSSTRVNLLRRTLLAAAAVVLLVVAGGFTLSWAENRGLTARAGAAVAGVDAIAAGAELPALADLRALDSLRAVVDQVSRKPPSGRRWGLYVGDDMAPSLRELWFERFRATLWPRARTRLIATLAGAPERVTEADDYRRLFDALKAHLLTSTEYERADSVPPSFFADELTRHWLGDVPPEPERDSLVRVQFAFLGTQLALRDDPFDGPSNTIETVRLALAGFQGIDPFYQALLSMAADGRSPASFADPAVRGGPAVHAAYTKDGWDRVQANLGQLRNAIEGDDWVLGNVPRVEVGDWPTIQDSLLDRYYNDYVRSWTEFLDGAHVERFTPRNATPILRRLGASGSPLIELLALVSRNTSVDSALIGRHFAAVHRVVPSSGDPSAAAGYLQALTRLASAFDQPDDPQAVGLVTQAADGLDNEIRALQLTAGGVSSQVQRLLNQPVGIARGAGEGIPRELLAQAIATFCTRFRELARGFPFGSGADASLEDTDNLLLPGRGLLSSSFADGPLAENVRELTRGFQALSSDVPRGFINSLNRAAAVRDLLYENDEPRAIAITLQPVFPADNSITEVVIEIGGEPKTFTPTQAGRWTFEWRFDQNQPARITVRTASGSYPPIEHSGRWGLVKLLRAADWPPGSNQAIWSLPGANRLGVNIDVASGRGNARIDDLSLSCTR